MTRPTLKTLMPLSKLKDLNFAAEIGLVTSASALCRVLRRNSEVASLREAIATGAITETSVGQFSDELLRDFSRGTRFPHELALAALCIAMEDRNTGFAEEFIADLARLRIVEMPIVSEVARECYQRWIKLPKVVTKTFAISCSSNSFIATKSTEPKLIHGINSVNQSPLMECCGNNYAIA